MKRRVNRPVCLQRVLLLRLLVRCREGHVGHLLLERIVVAELSKELGVVLQQAGPPLGQRLVLFDAGGSRQSGRDQPSVAVQDGKAQSALVSREVSTDPRPVFDPEGTEFRVQHLDEGGAVD